MSEVPPLPPPAPVPPGWYFDGAQQRWWDGARWGPPAPHAPRDANDRTLATVAHLGFVLGGFFLPLVLYLTSDDARRTETRRNAREALNFQITLILVSLLTAVGFVVMVMIGFGATASGSDSPAASGFAFGGFFLVWGAVMLIGLGSIVLSIIAAVRTSGGAMFRYPLCIRFVTR